MSSANGSANGSATEPQTEIVRASQLPDLCRRIFELRHPERIAEYEKALKKYERDLAKGGHKEVKVGETQIDRLPVKGYVVIGKDGQPKTIQRPFRPEPLVYEYRDYQRSVGQHAKVIGLLADAQFNRELHPPRVQEYAAEMVAGNWRDLLSDPISITATGQVVNGQHRIAAASLVKWEDEPGPAFLVIWNADPREAEHADGANRTHRDSKTISRKLLDAVRP